MSDESKLRYKWEQSSDYISISIYIPDIKIKDIKIDFKPRYLKISVKDKVLEGELYKPIYDLESFWYIDNDLLMIELSKVIISDEFLWDKLFINDKQGTRECSVKLSELSQKKQMEYVKDYMYN